MSDNPSTPRPYVNRGFLWKVSFIAGLGGILYGFDMGIIAAALVFVRSTFSLSTQMQEAVVSIVLVGAMIGAILGGTIADRFGLRATMIAGAAIYVLGLGVMAASGGPTGLLVSGVLIGVALSCTASSLGLTAAARAVPEVRRSRMLGIVAAAGSLGTFLIPLATQALLVRQA